MKNLRLLLAFAVVLTLLSSCKKSDPTSLSYLTSHKWNVTAYTRGYSDSTATHNLLATNATCTTTSYTEFHDYASNNSLRLAYEYITTNCPGFTSPIIQVSSWDLDNDNKNLYLDGSSSSGTGGKWYTITTLNSSTIVLTYVYQRQVGNTGAPNFNPVYDTVTETMTYSAQ
ncbi:MAG: hypothetical protein JWO03_58 [Bacteroidetes bacterium]|nr:hypothetical protein [Bacteroidota bacterium]